MRLIALTGYAGSGKDEVGKILVRDHGFARVAFADPMRDALYALDPIVCVLGFGGDTRTVRDLVDEYGWDDAKRKYPEIRALLQRAGTEVGRKQFGESFWLTLGMRAAFAHEKSVITDCRFENEARAVLDAGGEVWRVVRPGHGALNAHASETPLSDDLVTRTVLNDGSLSDLAYAILGAVS